MSLEISKSVEAHIHTITAAKQTNAKRKLSFWKKLKLVFTNITMEPILVLYVLPSAMASIATQNLSLEKACLVNLRMDEKICEALVLRNSSGYNETDEVAVQKLVATMNAWKNVIQSLIPSLLLMFWGSWSDKHKKRKPCVLFPIVGEIMTCCGFLLCTYFFYQLPMEYNAFFESVPPAITGGWFTSLMGIFSYISNISSAETRTLRIGAVSTFSNVSVTIGCALSGILFKLVGYYWIFFLALLMYLAGLIYGYFGVKEVGEKQIDGQKSVGFFRDFFDCEHVTQTYNVAFKKGERNRRARICVIMILVAVVIGPWQGEYNVIYLFVRYKFGWDEIDFSIYETFISVADVIGTLFSLMFFSKFLKVDDTMLGFISSASKILANFIYAFAPNTTIFYLGVTLEMFSGTSFIALRSIISKLVPNDELGKINSLFGVSEALMPLVYGPLYNIFYKMTIDVLPGAYFLLGSALTTPALFIYLWLYLEHRKDWKEDAKHLAQKENLLKTENGIKTPNNVEVVDNANNVSKDEAV